jgi:hypothetical protein
VQDDALVDQLQQHLAGEHAVCGEK